MAETLTKLRPDRDLQCYFQQPSAVAALSGTSASGFTVSGSWRQQLDWAVVEWNRDNVFEHPALRNLPDGNLSGVHLSYQEARTNCIPMDSTLYPTVDWPYLRVWTDAGASESLYRVPLSKYATPVGSYTAATAQLALQGTVTGGDYIELAWMDQHFNYSLLGNDTLATAATALAGIITANQETPGECYGGWRYDHADVAGESRRERESNRRVRDSAWGTDRVVGARFRGLQQRSVSRRVAGYARFWESGRISRSRSDHARERANIECAKDEVDLGRRYAAVEFRAQ